LSTIGNKSANKNGIEETCGVRYAIHHEILKVARLPARLNGEQGACLLGFLPLLKIADAYEKYVEFCQAKKMPVVLQAEQLVFCK
jgi:hypothetical protein